MIFKKRKIRVSYKIYGFITWSCIGIVLIFSMCAMKISGTFSINPFYNVGEVYEIYNNYYRTDIKQERGYQQSTGKVFLDKGLFHYSLNIYKNKNSFNYFCIKVDELSNDSIKCITFFDKIKDGETQDSISKEICLKEGINLISVPQNKFNVIRVMLEGNNGVSLKVKKMELRENKPTFTWDKMFHYMWKIFLGYLLLSIILIALCCKYGIKWNICSWIDTLQSISLAFFELIKPICFFKANKRSLRIFSFLVMFLYSVLVEINKWYYKYFKYHMVIYGIIILLIIILSLPNKCEKKSWKNPLVWSWMILWIIACISDFMMPKEFRYVGYFMLLVVGFFFFVWNNANKSEELVADFVKAVHLFFVCVSIFCLFCRPETTGIRYNGFCKNPSVFCLYLGTIWAVILGELEHKFQYKKNWISMLPYILECCVAFTFCWKSQSACPLISIILISIIWFIKMVIHANRLKLRRKMLIILTSIIVFIAPVYITISLGINYIPQKFGTTVTFEYEKKEAKCDFGMEVRAAGLEEKFAQTRLGEKIVGSKNISSLLSARDYYYKTYLRSMNLLGHKERPILWGHRRKPHNSILGIAYTYGVFAAVPYIIMLIATIERTFRYSRRKVKYASVPFYVCFSSIIMSLADNVEQPFVWLPWMGLYLMMGIVFDDSQLTDSDMESQNYSIE